MSGEDRIAIRSYRVCFALERRIHKIDRWRIPVPFGVPLRGIGYVAALLATILIAGRLPGIGALIAGIHPALRLVAAPVCGAYALCMWQIDGRPAHIGLSSWTRMLLAPRRLVAFQGARAQPRVAWAEAIVVAPDESTPRLRRGSVRGPATVVLRYPIQARARRRTLHVAQGGARPLWRGKQISVADGARLVLR